jgi:DNA-binding transcriptional MocR family regulator
MKYQDIAEDLARRIDAGNLAPGERLASVRERGRMLGVSANTVVEAYRLLERRGLVRARERSGFFVTGRAAAITSIPGPAPEGLALAPASLSEQVQAIYRASQDPRFLKLGAALADRAFFPDRALRRHAGPTRPGEPDGLTFSPAPGNSELRALLAERLKAQGMSCAAEDVVLTSGALESVFLSLFLLCRPGDVVGVESPTYFGTLQALETLGLTACELATDPYAGIDLAAFSTAARTRGMRACVVSANVQNPLGYVLSDERKAALAGAAAELGVTLVEDDIYGDLAYASPRPRPLKAFDDPGRESVVHCSSVSKTLGGGLRLGWLVGRELAARATRAKAALNGGSPALSERMVAGFMASGGYDRHLSAVRGTFLGRVEAVSGALAAALPPGCRLSRPAGGYILWLELPPGVSGTELWRRLMGQGIAVAPGAAFSMGKAHDGYVRLNCGLVPSPALDAALAAIGREVGRLARETGDAHCQSPGHGLSPARP